MSEAPTWEDRIAALRAKFDDLVDDIGMDDVVSKLGDITTEIAGLPGEIAGVRERGYAFAGYLERKASVLAEQWGQIREQVQEIVKQEVDRAQTQMSNLNSLWQRLELQSDDGAREKTFTALETSVDATTKAIEGARSRIDGMYGEVPGNASQTQYQLAQIKSYLDLAEQSSVSWGPTEALVLANKGEWVKSGKDKQDPDGYIFLTDQRLIFEQNEKVGGRFGFGGEQVQEVLFAIPVGTIKEATAEKKGMLGGIDLINLKLSEGDYAEMTIEVKGGVDCKWYVQQLNRVISGEIDKERAIPVDEAKAEAARSAPTACPTCGATLPSLARGVTELTCEYCGTMVRI